MAPLLSDVSLSKTKNTENHVNVSSLA